MLILRRERLPSSLFFNTSKLAIPVRGGVIKAWPRISLASSYSLRVRPYLYGSFYSCEQPDFILQTVNDSLRKIMVRVLEGELPARRLHTLNDVSC